MSTYRERREAKADRLREWADKREAKAARDHERASAMAAVIPFGQPILAGHYSAGRDRRYRDRIGTTMGRAVEHGRKAQDFERRAPGVESQLAGSIYSDDPDAVARLRERIADLEAERDRIKTYNASCRKAAKAGGVGDLSILDDRQRQEIATLARVASYQLRPGGGFPAYALSNLSGNIKRNRDRLAELERKAPTTTDAPDTFCPCGNGPFFYVPGRRRPDLCLDCGDEADREARGWHPENSRD